MKKKRFEVQHMDYHPGKFEKRPRIYFVYDNNEHYLREIGERQVAAIKMCKALNKMEQQIKNSKKQLDKAMANLQKKWQKKFKLPNGVRRGLDRTICQHVHDSPSTWEYLGGQWKWCRKCGAIKNALDGSIRMPSN